MRGWPVPPTTRQMPGHNLSPPLLAPHCVVVDVDVEVVDLGVATAAGVSGIFGVPGFSEAGVES